MGDAVALAPASGADIAEARVAGTRHPASVAKPVVTRERGSVPELAIARARPVTHPVVAAPVKPPAPPSPEPVSQPQPPPASAPVSAPVSVPAPGPSPESSPAPPSQIAASHGGSAQGPSTSGIGVGVDDGDASAADAIQVEEGDEYALSFSFYVQPTAYRMPGVDNLIMQFRGEEGERPSFGLQLWDDDSGSGHGLWSSGEAMDGEHFLIPLADGVWHEAAVYFRASSEGDGFYLAFLDGQPIEMRAGVSLIDPGSSNAQIEVGLFRDGERVEGTSEILFGAVRLGDALEPVLP